VAAAAKRAAQALKNALLKAVNWLKNKKKTDNGRCIKNLGQCQKGQRSCRRSKGGD